MTTRTAIRTCSRAIHHSRKPLPLAVALWTSIRTFSTTHRPSAAVVLPLHHHNDIDITPYFDQPSSSSSSSNVAGPPTGLFGQPELASPSEFLQLANRTVNRAQILVQRIKNARSSRTEMFKVVKNVDRLSDILCAVIDAAELVRHSHPDKAWIDAAHEVYESMCSFMNTLNTDADLYEVRKGRKDIGVVEVDRADVP